MTDRERIAQLEHEVTALNKDNLATKEAMVLMTEAMQKLLEHVRLTVGY